MPFTNDPKKPFSIDDKIKMFDRMCATAAVIALIIIMLIESGRVGEYKNLADMGLTAMIVVLAVSLVGSLFYKTKRK
jgi:heme A synthase